MMIVYNGVCIGTVRVYHIVDTSLLHVLVEYRYKWEEFSQGHAALAARRGLSLELFDIEGRWFSRRAGSTF